MSPPPDAGTPDPKMVTLYDLKSRGPVPDRPWSPNTTKARGALKLKKLPFRTVFIDYPDIEPVSKRLGLEPIVPTNPPKWQPPYTIPFISIPSPDGTSPKVIRDSLAIALELDTHFPPSPTHPPLLPSVPTHLPGTSGADLITRFDRIFNLHIGSPISSICIEPDCDNLRTELGAEFFKRTRRDNAGVEIDGVRERAGGLGRLWEKLREGMEVVVEMFPEEEGRKGGSRFWFGDQVSYADIIIGSYFFWISRVDEVTGGRERLFETLMNDVVPDDRYRRVWEGVKELVGE